MSSGAPEEMAWRIGITDGFEICWPDGLSDQTYIRFESVVSEKAPASPSSETIEREAP